MPKVIVIGSGFGGLGAAARIATHGYEVEIFEKRDKPGGRGYTYEIEGFKFDGGPTVITAPFMFDDIFELAGRRREDYCQFVPCDPFYRIYNHEGRHFNYNGDMDFILDQIEQWSPGDVEGYKRLMATTQPIFEKGFVQLADQPFLKPRDMIRIIPDLVKLQSYKTVYGYVSQFIQSDFLRRCFSFHPLLVGGNPFSTTSIYTMIHYLEREWGVWYALGGTGAVVDALVRLIEELGGTLHLDAEVEEILVEDKRAVGVRLADGSEHRADAVISNAEAAYTYTQLVPAQYRRWNADARYTKLTQYSMSLFVIYFGTKRRYIDSGLAHHNIILSERYKDLLTDIFWRKKLADDFSLYLHMPSLTDPTMSPEGCETFYVLSPVPHLGADVDWREQARPYRDAIMQFLEDNYLPDLQANIVAEHYIDPLHFRDTLNSHMGSAFSVQPLLTQSAWFRPHNRSEDVEALYLVGAGTHPGAGLPGVLSSSKIAEDLIVQDIR